MTLDKTLLDILACPDDHAPLSYDPAAAGGAGELACTSCDRVYPITDGIPVLLIDEARRASK